MEGRQLESCFGAQKAMAPNSSTEPVLVRHWSSSKAASRLGNRLLNLTSRRQRANRRVQQ